LLLTEADERQRQPPGLRASNEPSIVANALTSCVYPILKKPCQPLF
jgi:hypothetical protein